MMMGTKYASSYTKTKHGQFCWRTHKEGSWDYRTLRRSFFSALASRDSMAIVPLLDSVRSMSLPSPFSTAAPEALSGVEIEAMAEVEDLNAKTAS